MRAIWARLRHCERGASAMEYGLIVALIAMGLCTGLTTIANRTGGLYSASQAALAR